MFQETGESCVKKVSLHSFGYSIVDWMEYDASSEWPVLMCLFTSSFVVSREIGRLNVHSLILSSGQEIF